MPPAAPAGLPPRRGSRMNTRRTGLVVATAFALVGVGVVVLVALKQKPTGGSSINGRVRTADEPVGSVPNIPAQDASSDIVKVGELNKAQIQFVDRKDPTRIAGVLKFSSLEPLPGGRANITAPNGLLFMRDGRVIKIQAARGTIIRQPRSEEPESGSFDGGATISLYEPTSPGALVDTDRDLPTLVMSTESIRFDLALLEVASTDRWTMQSPQVSANGKGLRMVGNEVDGRLELGVFDQVDKVIIHRVARAMKRDEPNSKPSAASSTNRGAATASTPAAPATPPVPASTTPAATQPAQIAMYAIKIADDVRITSGKRSISGELAEVWVRFVNNQLAPGALGPTNANGKLSLPGATSPSGTASSSTPTSTAAGSPTSSPSIDDDIVMTWKGKLTIRPIDQAPAALAKDDVAVRLSSPTPAKTTAAATKPASITPVEFGDLAAGIQGQANALTYGATTREIALVGDKSSPVRLTAADRGIFQGESMRLNLGTGLGQSRGEGTLSQRNPGEGFDGPSSQRTISWKDQADIELVTKDGWATGQLRRAAAQGSVVASDGKVELKAGYVEALLEPNAITKSLGPDATFELLRVSAKEGVAIRTLGKDTAAATAKPAPIHNTASGANPAANAGVDSPDVMSTMISGGGSMTASQVWVDFEPTSQIGSPRASHVVAVGNVCANRGESQATAERLEADLSPGPNGELTVTQVDGQGGVHFIGPGGLDVRAPKFSADAVKQTIDLSSPMPEGVRIARQGAIIYTSQLHADNVNQTVASAGPGKIVFHKAAAGANIAAEDAGDMTATWSQRMSLSEKEGKAKLVGDVQVVAISGKSAASSGAEAADKSSTPESSQVDKLWADIIELHFTQTEQPTGRTGPDGKPETRRQLTKAIATGKGGPNSADKARIESVRTTAADATAADSGRRLVYIEADTFTASETESKIEVPGPGRLLVDERGAKTSPSNPAANNPGKPNAPVGLSIMDGKSMNGSTLISWTNNLSLLRDTGIAQINGGVRLIHRPETSSPTNTILTLDCDQMLASIRFTAAPTSATGADALGGGAEFLSGLARGNVQAQGDDQRKLIANEIAFDAKQRILTAAGDGLVRATLNDPAKPPVAARKIIWNLATERIEIIDPAPVSKR